ncbi:hypothetical protein [uncultured Bradyrhizobium sp.]|uniref:hypothetical protein n=1 Tax=uncultured Bradyrhizobium sp. TaxID=199684 RepID=UPI002624BF62|nr:hypothetical protein [uncultured Bradyrhizobium sp.]
MARLVVACLGLLSPTGSPSSAAPAPLRGISVDLSWTDNRVEKFLDTGAEKPGYQTSQIQLYISEQGRFFSRFNRVAKGKNNRLVNSAVSGEGRSVLNWRFEGRSIAADQKFAGSGARRIVVSFGDDASSCSLRVIHGKEGRGPIRYPGLTSHRPIELVRIEVINTSCQVRQGNVFGQ